MSAQALFLSPDLMFSSRITSAVKQLGGHCHVAPNLTRALELLASEPICLVVVDLESPGLEIASVIRVTGKNEIPVVAYASHVREQLLASATQVGCTEVHPRSRFNAQLNSILLKYLTPNSNQQVPT